MRKTITFVSLSIFIVLSTSCSKSQSEIGYRYFFRGFATLSNEQAATYPSGTYLIKTDDDWHDFMDKYIPGVYYFYELDFTKYYLAVCIEFPARPSYTSSSDIKDFIITDNKIEPEFIYSDINSFYVQNTDNAQHCYVSIAQIKVKDIPTKIDNGYVKGMALPEQ